MSTLTRRLGRIIKNTRGQFIALISIVMIGVLVYISMNTAFSNLSRSQETFYEENHFADYFFHVVRAPEGVVKQIEALPGVINATGRIQKDVSVYREDGTRAIARLTSYPLPMDREVNQLHLLSGNMFENQAVQIEAVVDPQYAEANQLHPGDKINIISEGRKVPLRFVGTATSPEFVYPMKDASSLLPDPKEFGIVMIPHLQAQQILNMTGQVNQVVIQLTPDTDPKKLVPKIEEILEPYGKLASYPRSDQLSHAALQAELDGLKVMSRFMPIIFFLIAAAIQYILLTRLIKSQRPQIGIMKALGYSNRDIILHYTGYGLAVAIAGTIPGIVFGVILASVFSDMYAMFFSLPQTIGGVNGKVLLLSILLTTSVAGISGWLASRGVSRIRPAEAMKAEVPKIGGKILLERWGSLWKKMNTSWKMSFRTAARNKTRFLVTVLGVASTAGILILALFTSDAMDYMMTHHFTHENRYDYSVHFSRPIASSEISSWWQWPEVENMEPVLEVPVQMSIGNTGTDGETEDELLMGLRTGQYLKGIFDEEGNPISLPEEGILINERTAKKLAVKIGDYVNVETKLGIGSTRKGRLKVMGVNRQLLGAGSYISFQTANHLLGEQGTMTSVLLKVEANKGSITEERLKEMSSVDSILSRQKEKDNFFSLLDSMIYFIGIMVAFAAILGLAIIYNASTMNFSERRRELASLKVLGYTKKEIRGLLSKEVWMQTGVGLLIGLPGGKLLGKGYLQAVNTDLFSFPAIIYPRTYILTALGIILFVWLGHTLATRRLNDLDMVEAMKERD
ncbi:MAG: FtsX-like permease family protein [Bacillota bacterium]|nr:FtsX-like permease family protein [Bacillota bacterium]